MCWSSVETIIIGSKLFCEIMIHRMTKNILISWMPRMGEGETIIPAVNKRIMSDYLKNGPLPASFSLFSSFQYTWQ